MKGFAVAAVVLAMFGIAACGGSDSGGSSAEDQVTEQVSAFSDAIASGDYAAACDMYDSSTAEFFEDPAVGGCEALVEGTYGALTEDQIAGIEADTIDIQGDKANVDLANGDVLILKQEGDEWMVTLD